MVNKFLLREGSVMLVIVLILTRSRIAGNGSSSIWLCK